MKLKLLDKFLNLRRFREKDTIESLWLIGKGENQKDLERKVINGEKTIILRWHITSWCNYNCPYCGQNHKRLKTSHAFDVATVSEWIKSFDAKFGKSGHNLVLVLTGGEPMLDTENMAVFLNIICGKSYLLNLRIDTNFSWDPAKYAHIKNKEKIWLMCTYHPHRAEESVFMRKIIQVAHDGYNIGMVNFVITKDNSALFENMADELHKQHIPLHPNPLWDSKGRYSEEALRLFKKHLPENDFLYRSGISRTFLKKCLFPAIGYQMGPNGKINVGCHPSLNANFLNEQVPSLFKGYARCPKISCKCLDMYSFLRGFNRNLKLNPLLCYKEELLNLHKKTQ